MRDAITSRRIEPLLPGPAADAPASPAAVRILKDEHLAIASVLYSLRHAVRQVREHGAAPDVRLLGAILDYIEAFPERLHHPKEEAFLFAALAERCEDARPLIALLAAEHARGDASIRDLRERLARCHGAGPAFDEFAEAVDAYAAFHWRHMTREEEVLLPLALRHLSTADWERIGAAFRANDDPLVGLTGRQDLDRLFRTILELATAMERAAAR